MIKRFGFAILSLVLLFVLAGCSCGASNSPNTTTPTPAANIRLARQAELAKVWTVRQIEINLESATSILLKLGADSTVDGYFYLEKGFNVDFEITGQSSIFKSTAATAGSANITSDRFSFKSGTDQGIAYTLKFTPVTNKNDTRKVTPVIFLEVIYPKTGEIFTPMDTK
jgi:hypothetical protein